MKRSRFSAEQIIGILREAEGESTVKAVAAKHNVSEAMLYAWNWKYGEMDVEEARRLRALEEETGRLKRIVAELSVQNHILKEVNAKKW
ncbi:MAG: transposase [Verrucomicrobiota bacterium]